MLRILLSIYGMLPPGGGPEQPPDTETDVVAIIGYVLFIVSIIIWALLLIKYIEKKNKK